MQNWITYYAKLLRDSFLRWVAAAKASTSYIADWDPRPIILRATLAGQNFEAEAIQKIISQQFTLTSPRAVEYATKYGASEVKGIQEATRASMRAVLSSSLQGKLTSAEQKKLLRDMIGVSNNQVAWVQSYATHMKDAGLDGPALEKAVAKYTEKLIKQRAETIAITEAAKATAMGQQAAQEELVSRGIISKSEYGIEWVAAPSERTCPICGALDGQKGMIGEGINGKTVPAHPRCRCRIVLVKL
jgi:SPP1 gp7 family putative phage head morphogenesis protein